MSEVIITKDSVRTKKYPISASPEELNIWEEAKSREKGRAFLHIISFDEFFSHCDDDYKREIVEEIKREKLDSRKFSLVSLPELDSSETKKTDIVVTESETKTSSNVVVESEVKQSAKSDVSENNIPNVTFIDGDLSNDNLEFLNSSDRNSIILSKVMISRIDSKTGISPLRGDMIRFKFVKVGSQSSFFYDGQKVIVPDMDYSDHYLIPYEFKVGSEFPPNYWDDYGFIGRAPSGDFWYDVGSADLDLLNELSVKITYSSTPALAERGKTIIDTVVRVYRDNKSGCFIITRCAASNTDKAILKFMNNGRCFHRNHLGHEGMFFVEDLIQRLRQYIDTNKCVVCPDLAPLPRG